MTVLFSDPWKKPFFLSLGLHLLLLPAAAGLLHFPAAKPDPEDTLLELTLAAEPTAEAAALPTHSSVAASLQPLPPSAAPADTAADTPSAPVATAAPQQPVIRTSAPEMTEVGTSTASAKSSDFSGTAGETSSSSAASASPADIIRPSLYAKTEPVYPAEARQANIEGTVILKVQILTSGHPGSVSIWQSSGHSALDQAAIDAVTEWQFTPAKNSRTGEAISCTIIQPISFHLH